VVLTHCSHTGLTIGALLSKGRSITSQAYYTVISENVLRIKDLYHMVLSFRHIVPSQLPTAAPIFFVKKKDGTLRLVINYRGLNEITGKNRYPLPLFDSRMERLGKAKPFTMLYLYRAYNLVRVSEDLLYLPDFRMKYRQFEC
jgi:hypothetical protein